MRIRQRLTALRKLQATTVTLRPASKCRIVASQALQHIKIMPSATTAPIFLSNHLLPFLQDCISISLAAVDVDGNVCITKTQGCRISADRQRITTFASRTASTDVLRCIAAQGRIAAVFSMPTTHETYQIKGYRPAVEPLQPGDLERLLAYRDAFAAEIEPFGFPPKLTHTLFGFPVEDLLAISFEPSAIFDQTPGPKAGSALEEAR